VGAAGCLQAPTLGALLGFTQSSAASNPDPSVRASLAPGLTDAYIGSAAAAVANLNAQADAAGSATDVEKTAYYAQSVVRTLPVQAHVHAVLIVAWVIGSTAPDVVACRLSLHWR
jgi:hypothetical protein